MITKWTSHLKTAEEKEQFEKEIRGSVNVLNRLLQIYEEDLRSLEDAETSVKAYDLPNWDYRQAHVNGAKGDIKRYIKLLTLDQKDN